jgi:transmembrane sensor
MDDLPPLPIVDWARIARYLSGECLPAEAAAVERWMEGDPARAQLVARLRAAWQEAAELPPEAELPHAVDLRAGWGTLAGRLGLGEHAARRQRAPHIRAISSVAARRHAAWRAPVAVAAGVLLVAFGFLTGRQGGSIWSLTNPSGHVYHTGTGEREAITLADGTQITLAPASTLDVPQEYRAGRRSVALIGEAFCSVVHDAAHPFSVRAGRAVATDIGTAFDVRAYESDHDVRVAVADGSVAVRSVGAAFRPPVPTSATRGANGAELGAGDVAVVADTAIGVTHGADVAALTSWTAGDLVYHDAPAAAVVDDLRRWYAVDLSLGDQSLAGRRVTATFARGESTDQVIEVFRAVLGARLERHGTRIMLTAGTSSNP